MFRSSKIQTVAFTYIIKCCPQEDVFNFQYPRIFLSLLEFPVSQIEITLLSDKGAQ